MLAIELCPFCGADLVMNPNGGAFCPICALEFTIDEDWSIDDDYDGTYDRDDGTIDDLAQFLPE